MDIVMCAGCDGYGTVEDDHLTLNVCDWCGGAGYVYRDARGIDQRIPDSDYPRIAAQLERLERERLRGLGYTGSAKKPWEQHIRKKSRDE